MGGKLASILGQGRPARICRVRCLRGTNSRPREVIIRTTQSPKTYRLPTADGGRTWLRVPYGDKERAKKLGAKWDQLVKMWWIPAYFSKKPFHKWLKESPKQ